MTGGGGGCTAYTPEGITISSATRLSKNSALTGAVNSKLFSGSLWFKHAAISGGGNDAVLFIGGSGNAAIFMNDAGEVYIEDAATGNLLMYANNAAYDDGAWHHLMWSVDMNNAANRHLYIDGVSDINITTYTNANLDFTDTDWMFGSALPTSQNNPWGGDVADVWIALGQYIDLSVQANREKFYLTSAPVYMGAAGDLPTGSAPTVYMQGALASWATNKGSGGGFTVSAGALADAATDPPQGCQ